MIFKENTKISKIDLKEFITKINYNYREVNMTKFSKNHLHALNSYIFAIESTNSLALNMSQNNSILIHELLTEYSLLNVDDVNLLMIELLKIRDFLNENITTISDSIRLSKTNILMNIYFRFLHIDKNGIIKNFDPYACATYIGCSVQQIKNNLNQLSDLGILWFSKFETNNYTIWLKHFDSGIYQEELKPGSTYLYMTRDLFSEFVKSHDVDVLRISLRQFINYDNSKNNIKDPVISFKNIKQYLPTSKKNRNSINTLLEDSKRIFKNQIVENKVIFSLKEKFKASFDHFVFQNELIEERVDKMILEVQSYFELDISKKDRIDLLQMTTQYGFNIVSTNFKSYIKYFRKKLYQNLNSHQSHIDFNLGIVRNLIEDDLKESTIIS